ncbi:MAG: hypothetical protein AAF355_09590 [Myxococcota bacterium]
MSRLDEILVCAELIQANRKEGLPDFSGDGEYLVQYSVGQLTSKLGTREDDSENTFTARLLLLLESRPLLGDAVYDKALNKVIEAYWRDYTDRKDRFSPSFLANDILRLWRTLCVNYEKSEGDNKKIKNYKLRHSRILTCFSALAYFAMIMRKNKTVTPEDAFRISKLSPTERVEKIAQAPELEEKARSSAREVLKAYEGFIENPDGANDEFPDREDALGKEMFTLLQSIDADRFSRHLLV